MALDRALAKPHTNRPFTKRRCFVVPLGHGCSTSHECHVRTSCACDLTWRCISPLCPLRFGRCCCLKLGRTPLAASRSAPRTQQSPSPAEFPVTATPLPLAPESVQANPLLPAPPQLERAPGLPRGRGTGRTMRLADINPLAPVAVARAHRFATSCHFGTGPRSLSIPLASGPSLPRASRGRLLAQARAASAVTAIRSALHAACVSRCNPLQRHHRRGSAKGPRQLTARTSCRQSCICFRRAGCAEVLRVMDRRPGFQPPRSADLGHTRAVACRCTGAHVYLQETIERGRKL